MRKEYRIHPAIGIARVGDSPDRYFIGSEAPGVPSSLNEPDALTSSDPTYKDAQGRIKRQGARFRIYEYTHDDADVVTEVREITAAEAHIEWEVHLANRKAAAPMFNGPRRRNAGVAESQLISDAGTQKIAGAGQGMQRVQGFFMDTAVPLGDLLTDSAGRLIVLGGFGASRSVPPGQPLVHFADNDGWCDDISDGPLRATIRLHEDTETLVAEAAWVIVGPPDFAPAIENVITLYDLVYDIAAKLDPSLAITESTQVSFTRDIYPILRRVSNLHWVTVIADLVHGPGKRHDFLNEEELASVLANNSKVESSAVWLRRQRIFNALRSPGPGNGGGTMPFLSGGETFVTLTEVQYRRMERWAKGEFEADWPGEESTPRALEELPEQDRPHALDRAALDSCVGAGLFPGIEAGQIMRAPETYQRPFRIVSKRDGGQREAGDLTARMAVPWQADFFACSFEHQTGDWWPAQRPNQILRGQEPNLKRENWVPEDWGKGEDMVEKWSRLGFIVKEQSSGKYVERERAL